MELAIGLAKRDFFLGDALFSLRSKSFTLGQQSE
jgi:hypothetical protein